MNSWQRKLVTARERFHAEGLGGLLLHLTNRLFGLMRRKKNAEWLARKDRVDQFFDHVYDVDTRGITKLEGLEITGRNRSFGIPHIASDPDKFSDALASLQIRHEHYLFIDLGSGKGRALVLALSLPFRRIVGVEFALELHGSRRPICSASPQPAEMSAESALSPPMRPNSSYPWSNLWSISTIRSTIVW